MPYLRDLARRLSLTPRVRRPYCAKNVDPDMAPPAEGAELNFLISDLVDEFIERHGLSYHTLEEIDGALGLAQHEFRRRVVGPYEDLKIEENGEVFSFTVGELKDLRRARNALYAEVVRSL